jgi:hypothetical protein
MVLVVESTTQHP